MKRLRDDNYPPFKRPFGTSRGESYGQALSTGGGVGHKLTTNDALHYLKEVKEMFQDQREKYEHFLEVMKDFKAQRIDTEGVIARVKELFKGHNNLIYGFNTFLPKGYEITLDDVDTPSKKVVFDDAISFVNKIKKRFQNDGHVYKSFLEILDLYRKERKSISEVHEEVTHLFEEHSDLLDEFTRFLPHNSAPASVHHVQFGRSTFRCHDEKGSTMMHLMPSSHQSDMDQHQWRRDKISTSRTELDLRVENPDMGGDKTMVKMHKDQKKRGKESRDQRTQDVGDNEHEHDNNRESNNQQLVEKRKPIRKEGPPLVSCDDKNTLKTMCNQELIFCETVKEKLGSSDDYQAFLKCLHLYSTEIISRSELQSLVADILGKYPDLMEGFKEFLERCENIDGFLAGVSNRKSLWNDGSIPKSVRVEDKDKEPKHDIEGSKEKERNKEKYWAKSIQDLDLSDCQRCTPSYRLLPEDYPITTASQRSEVGAQVLNDHWVSVTSGSEDYSFKHMRRNQYEESLFRCEDDRFELDMLLESVSSTAKRVEDLLNSINDRTINIDSPTHIEEHFTALNLRCIERLYSDHGLDVLDILRKSPVSALPVILTRLKQKQEEWTWCRSEYNRVWAEVYAKNHYKSLDHRSFYFKQQDSKNLSAKSLVAEIKEIKDNMQKEDNMLHAVAAGHERSLEPHFVFEYSDIDVHEDIRRLIKYSCEEVCSKEQLHKVMRLWSKFLEPTLSILCQHHHTDGAENVSGANNCTAEIVGANALQNDRIPDAEPEPQKVSSMGDQSVFDVAKSSVFTTCSSSASKELGFLDQGTTHNDYRLNRARADRGLNCSVGSAENAPDQLKLSSLPEEESNNGRADLGSGPSNETRRDSDTTKVKESGGFLDPAPASISNSKDGSGIDQSLPESGGRCKSEKEEGELSPNADFEEEHDDRSLQVAPEAKDSGNAEDNVIENEGDADDEDSDNGSDAGDDASGSESAGDECSREEHEDGERDEMDCKAESESEVEIHCNGVDGAGLPVSERFLASVKPVTKYAFLETLSRDIVNTDCPVFYGNDDFYVLFRLHHMLYERIIEAKTNSRSSKAMWNHSRDFSTSDPYASFMNALFNLLDGTSDNARFEDDCRAIIGNQAYVLFTLDKLIYKLVKQLQAVATDDVDGKLLQLSEYENSRKSGRFVDSVYYENARVILHDENIYRFECAPSPSRLSIRLMDSISEKPDVVAVTMEPIFSAYLYKDFLSVSSCKKEPAGLLLQRNKRKYANLGEHSATSLAMEGVLSRNGLECKIVCGTSKIFYVLDTEDFFSRPVNKRKNLPAHMAAKLNQRKVQRFHKILQSVVPAEHNEDTK